MNLFDTLVSQALSNKPELAPLRFVVEKELLHYDILRIMQDHNLLSDLTFIGGTCLRMCYDSGRLSEDLDFTGGASFTRTSLTALGKFITSSLEEKYGLTVTVTEPEKDILNVDTWKIKIITRPEKKHMPAQRINIDICAVPSYERKPLLVQNKYEIDMGNTGLIIACQSREEIFTDKLLAFALRPNRIKYRDLWDIMWLSSRNVKPRLTLIEPKLSDRNRTKKEFNALFTKRLTELVQNTQAPQEFKHEMERFLPHVQLPNGNLENYWHALLGILEELGSGD